MQDTRLKPRERLIRYALHRYWRLSRGMTLGVRAVVLAEDDRVFLVRHTYTPGWHLPGGGVEPGETLRDALAKELREEGNIEIEGEPVLHGVFFNRHASNRDHVAVYVVRDFRQTAPRGADRELAETGFFALSDLPDATTAATRQRIEEVVGELKPGPYWSD